MSNYDAFSHTFSNSRKGLYWPEIDTILSDIEKNKYTSVLDIGCGNGRFASEMRKKLVYDIRYLGTDNSKWMIEEASNLLPDERFLIGSMTDLADILGEEKYDAIVLLASFHHLGTREERLQCLKNLKDYLAQDGSAYMTNWNLRDQEKYTKNHRGNSDYAIKIGEYTRYYHGFTLAELENLFLEAGWDIQENRIFEGGRNIYSRIRLLKKY
jgi:tRNA (uracil-5-)-methyltransferase TRM9